MNEPATMRFAARKMSPSCPATLLSPSARNRSVVFTDRMLSAPGSASAIWMSPACVSSRPMTSSPNPSAPPLTVCNSSSDKLSVPAPLPRPIVVLEVLPANTARTESAPPLPDDFNTAFPAIWMLSEKKDRPPPWVSMVTVPTVMLSSSDPYCRAVTVSDVASIKLPPTMTMSFAEIVNAPSRPSGAFAPSSPLIVTLP